MDYGQVTEVLEATEENIKYAAYATLMSVWDSIDRKKMDNQRWLNIWNEFGNKVAASSKTTDSYEEFVMKLCKKFDILSLRGREINMVSNQTKEFKHKVLKLIREEYLFVIQEVRMANDNRMQRIREAKQEKKEMDKDE